MWSQKLSRSALGPCVMLSCLTQAYHVHGPLQPCADTHTSVQAPNYLCYTYKKPKKVSREEGKRYSGQCQKWCVLHHPVQIHTSQQVTGDTCKYVVRLQQYSQGYSGNCPKHAGCMPA